MLVEFWDFCRVQSLRTLPYLRAWNERYAEAGLRVVGVHTGGFEFSRDEDAVRAAVERIEVPVYLASAKEDPFDGATNVADWSRGLSQVRSRIVPGAAHAMAIYFDVRDELLEFVRTALVLR